MPGEPHGPVPRRGSGVTVIFKISIVNSVIVCNTIDMGLILTDIERMREVASSQHGVISRKQALSAGVSSESIRQLAFRGRIERVVQGIYRVPQACEDDKTALQIAVLWTGRDEAVLGFETALYFYGLCDYAPQKVHIIVPAKARIRRSSGDGYILHYLDLAPDDVCMHDGLRVTTPLRSLIDSKSSGVSQTVLSNAFERAAERGLILGDQLDALASPT